MLVSIYKTSRGHNLERPQPKFHSRENLISHRMSYFFFFFLHLQANINHQLKLQSADNFHRHSIAVIRTISHKSSGQSSAPWPLKMCTVKAADPETAGSLAVTDCPLSGQRGPRLFASSLLPGRTPAEEKGNH